MTDLGTLGTDPCSRAYAINSKGQIVGGSSDCNTFLHAYLWERGGPMMDLNTLVAPGAGLTLTLAMFIKDHAEIVGTGQLSNGDTHAFVLVPCGDGDADCGDPSASTAAAIQSGPPVAECPSTTTPVDPALGGRGMPGWLLGRRFPGSRDVGPTSGPTR